MTDKKGKRKNKTPTYNMTLEDLHARDRRTRKKTLEEAFVIAMGIPLIVLRDKYGFGSKRINEFMEHVHNTREAIESGNVDFEDLLKTIQEETGVDVYERTRREL